MVFMSRYYITPAPHSGLEYPVLQFRPQRRVRSGRNGAFGDEVHLHAELLFEEVAEPDQVEQGSAFVEAHEEIEIAVVGLLAADV